MTDVSPYTPVARRVLETDAPAQAAALGHDSADTGHLLLGLIVGRRRGMVGAVLQEMAVDFAAVQREAEDRLGLGRRLGRRDAPLSEAAWRAVELGLRQNPVAGARRAGTDHLLLGLLAEGGTAAEALRAHGITPETFAAARERLEWVCYGCAEGSTGEGRVRKGLPEELEALIERAEEGRRARTAAIEAEDYERAIQERDREREALRHGVEAFDEPVAKAHLGTALNEVRLLRERVAQLAGQLGHRC